MFATDVYDKPAHVYQGVELSGLPYRGPDGAELLRETGAAHRAVGVLGGPRVAGPDEEALQVEGELGIGDVVEQHASPGLVLVQARTSRYAVLRSGPDV